MSGLLLDTHVVVWWAISSPRVRPEWVERIVAPDNRVYVSAATVWEIEIKKRSGKLDFGFDVLDLAGENDFELLAISPEDAAAAGSVEWEHRDPFDRMLVSQARRRELVLVSADDAIRAAPGVRVL